ncbi:flagellar transcriptional regulator FlhD [Trinickia terrae]|uniref:Flagellar transcriptional regulator FlhD n=1 Tax=Trinickia terrae TaxID=2571161 RepID=A0A4U1I9X8_9BURK|nr:flagellar transcriptional regulator FlhD [Trinickia terrae]TKC90145.1 flagellar transcriptional regulator FlhD [Trinickia terrae]
MGLASSELHDEVKELNLSYLMLAQRMLRDDKEAGMYRLGFSVEVADVVAKLTMAQILRLSTSATLLCRFRFNDHAVLSALADKRSKVPQQTAGIHQAIVLAGQTVEQPT